MPRRKRGYSREFPTGEGERKRLFVDWVPPKLLKAATAKATRNGVSLRVVILRLLSSWAGIAAPAVPKPESTTGEPPTCIYGLCRPDGSIFYVGRGKSPSERMRSHIREAKSTEYPGRTMNPRSVAIRDILAGGGEIGVCEIEWCIGHHEANAAERRVIREIGIENLTNVHPGGGAGPYARRPYPPYDLLPVKPSDAPVSSKPAHHLEDLYRRKRQSQLTK